MTAELSAEERERIERTLRYVAKAPGGLTFHLEQIGAQYLLSLLQSPPAEPGTGEGLGEGLERRAVPELAAIVENCRMAYRAAEMSAEIMRDARRTGGWEGSERTARAFDRIAKNAKAAHDSLKAMS